MATSQWPTTLERTTSTEKTEYTEGPGFQVSEERALAAITEELEKMGANNIEVDTLGEDVVVRFQKDEERIVGCDKYNNLRDNSQAIAKYIKNKRAIERYNVTTPSNEWSNTTTLAQYEERKSLFQKVGGALSGMLSGEEQEEVESRGLEDQEAAMVLGVDVDAPEDKIKDHSRELLKEHHPDTGGDEESFKAVMNAKATLLG